MFHYAHSQQAGACVARNGRVNRRFEEQGVDIMMQWRHRGWVRMLRV